MQAFIYEA